MKFTMLTYVLLDKLTERYSEMKETAGQLVERVNQRRPVLNYEYPAQRGGVRGRSVSPVHQ